MAGCCTNKIIDIKPLSAAHTRQWITCTLNGRRTHRGERASYYVTPEKMMKIRAAEQTPRVRNLLSQCALSATRKLIQTKEVKLTHFLHLNLISDDLAMWIWKQKMGNGAYLWSWCFIFTWKCDNQPQTKYTTKSSLFEFWVFVEEFNLTALLLAF